MAEVKQKEVAFSQPCPVCGKPSYVQYDKNGKFFTMCTDRHPDNPGCGARIYFGQLNTASMKAAHARKGSATNDNTKTPPKAANDNGAGDGGGERKPSDKPVRKSDGFLD